MVEFRTFAGKRHGIRAKKVRPPGTEWSPEGRCSPQNEAHLTQRDLVRKRIFSLFSPWVCRDPIRGLFESKACQLEPWYP